MSEYQMQPGEDFCYYYEASILNGIGVNEIFLDYLG